MEGGKLTTSVAASSVDTGEKMNAFPLEAQWHSRMLRRRVFLLCTVTEGEDGEQRRDTP